MTCKSRPPHKYSSVVTAEYLIRQLVQPHQLFASNCDGLPSMTQTLTGAVDQCHNISAMVDAFERTFE